MNTHRSVRVCTRAVGGAKAGGVPATRQDATRRDGTRRDATGRDGTGRDGTAAWERVKLVRFLSAHRACDFCRG